MELETKPVPLRTLGWRERLRVLMAEELEDDDPIGRLAYTDHGPEFF
ncbi:MAG TPA: hypothetical protein VHB02_02990 [Acidimicrobiales bacterium]|nr:hypothetical protein [Acidimicrobiales bacterium]